MSAFFPTIEPLILLLFLFGCSHRRSASASLEGEWWMNPALSEVPLAGLARLRIAGETWQEVAAALGLSPEDFYAARWGNTPIQVLSTDGEPTLGIYLEDDSEQARGILVRNKGLSFPTDVAEQLTAIAAQSGYGEKWDLYVGGEYTRLVSQSRPLVEIGCLTNRGTPLCHAKVFSTTIDPAAFTQIRGNEDALRVRSINVR